MITLSKDVTESARTLARQLIESQEESGMFGGQSHDGAPAMFYVSAQKGERTILGTVEVDAKIFYIGIDTD